MLTCVKDLQGNIICACEWRKVNEHCVFDNSGEYIWVHTIEVSKPYENNGMIYKLIKQILDEMPEAKYCWFRREKYNHRIKGYSRRRWEKLIKEKNYALAY